MTSRSRESLKRYFREGALPDEDHFADLIDSMLNMSDEGFRKTVHYGFEVYASQGHDALLSFFRDQEPESPAWQIGLSGASDLLHVRGRPESGLDLTASDEAPTLALDARRRVGVGTATPRVALDVAGVISSDGRRGHVARSESTPLRADGSWQNLTDELQGCQAFELTAGVGVPRGGRFALVHAIALNTYNPTLGWLNFLNRRRGIRQTNAWYGRRCDRLHLRWEGNSGRNAKYRLQIRSGCDFGPDVVMRAYLTRLWFDPHMTEEDDA